MPIFVITILLSTPTKSSSINFSYYQVTPHLNSSSYSTHYSLTGCLCLCLTCVDCQQIAYLVNSSQNECQISISSTKPDIDSYSTNDNETGVYVLQNSSTSPQCIQTNTISLVYNSTSSTNATQLGSGVQISYTDFGSSSSDQIYAIDNVKANIFKLDSSTLQVIQNGTYSATCTTSLAAKLYASLIYISCPNQILLVHSQTNLSYIQNYSLIAAAQGFTFVNSTFIYYIGAVGDIYTLDMNINTSQQKTKISDSFNAPSNVILFKYNYLFLASSTTKLYRYSIDTNTTDLSQTLSTTAYHIGISFDKCNNLWAIFNRQILIYDQQFNWLTSVSYKQGAVLENSPFNVNVDSNYNFYTSDLNNGVTRYQRTQQC
ncbi:unnamed protein product [Didymodactylos carnosus]|uniref:Transmembrane protein n=1 Tax=Didymodactylos carnosus TaxID=1234261 RepID=A0A815EK95_9BILA|nr:unnamed protein product [Didymodactylos carnosus]CAF4151606.1 unnamed protein product [Didymodactylos carnosus]